MPIPTESSKIHGIVDADVQGKPTFKELAQGIIDFIDKCDLCGFNISRFDLPILESEFKRAGIWYSKEGRQILDVQNIYHKLEPRDLGSAHLKYCGMPLENAHRAKSDVRATINVLEAQLKQNEKLPRNVSGLQDFCNPKDDSWIDASGKLVWFRGKPIITFGKHKGKTLEFLSKNEPAYLQWMLGIDFQPEVKDIIKKALGGNFLEMAESQVSGNVIGR